MSRERPLRVGIDARELLAEQPTGVERVVYHFVESLNREGRPDHEYLLFLDGEPSRGLMDRLPGRCVVEPVRFPRLQRVADLWISYQMRRMCREHRLDAFVSPNTWFPFAPVARITTVHGLEWYFCAAEYRMVEKIKHWTWFQLCTRFSTGMVTFAHNTYADILKLRPGCDIPSCVVPEGVNPLYREIPEAERRPDTLERYRIGRPFVLSVCSHEPRKKLDALIRSFGMAARKHDLPHHLVLIGRAGWKSSRLLDLIASENLVDRVHLPGFVPDDDLLQLYNHADLFVYPSKYEGFGLPLLEAMACGVPLVTSDSSSLREVAGDAAILIDPLSDEALASGIARGLTDEGLRSELCAAGLRRVQEFSWDSMTRSICEFVSSRTKDRHDGATRSRSGRHGRE